MQHQTEMEKIEKALTDLGYKKVSISYAQGVISATFLDQHSEEVCISIEFGHKDDVLGESDEREW